MLLPIAAMLLSQAAPAAVASEASVVHYDIVLEIDPRAGRLKAKAVLTGTSCRSGVQRLFMNRGLEIRRITIDGHEVLAVLPKDDTAFLLEEARAIDLPCARKTEVTYEGSGRLNVDGRNQVSANLVELSIYGSWYPLVDTKTPITARVRTWLPTDWTVASNGIVKRASDGGMVITCAQPTIDLTIVASPHFRWLTHGTGLQVLVARGLAAVEVGRAIQIGADAASTFRLFSRWMGPARTSGSLTIVFTPRPGPLNYSRLPIIVMPQSALAATESPSEESLSSVAKHEVAHFWSNASRASGDDWINEGIAEYLALRAIVQLDPDQGKRIYKEMVARSGAAGSGFSLSDPGSHVASARYTRPALMLTKVQERSSAGAMTALLRAVATSKTDVTTPAFIGLVQRIVSAKMADWVSTCVSRTDAGGDCW